jgi:Tfp pilus assembly protein PilN
VPGQINLLPKKDLADTALGKVLKFSLTYGRYIIVGTQLIVLLAFFSRFKLDRELTDLQESVEQKQTIVESLVEFENEVRLIQDRLATIKTLKSNHDLIRSSLESIKKTLPPGNTLVKLDIGKGVIDIAGISQDEQSIASLINQFSASPLYSSVQFGQIKKQDKKSEGAEGISFNITLNLASDVEASGESLRKEILE